MTLKEELKREREAGWATNEDLALAAIDMIKSELKCYLRSGGFNMKGFNIKVQKKYLSYYKVYSFECFLSIFDDFGIKEKLSLNNITTKDAEPFLAILAKKLKEEGFSAIKIDCESGELIARMDLE